MSYEVVLLPSAERDLDALPTDVRRRIARRLLALENDPRPAGIAALKGCPPGTYRLRVGNYRASYRVDDTARTVSVLHIGDRKRFYDGYRRRQ